MSLASNAVRWTQDAFRYVTFGYSQRRGVYRSFAEAEAEADAGKRVGFNHRDLALKYRAELSLRLDVTDYPVLFHLSRISHKSQCTILDFGGNVGTHYLRYMKYLNPGQFNWIVCDLPEITKVGRAACGERPNVAFVNDIAEIGTARIDIFLACNSLQYAGIEHPDLLLQELIEEDNRPAHILFDQLALCGGERFVTLQNGGSVRYPHHVYNRNEFIEDIAKLGYQLIDDWNNDCGPSQIPFYRETQVHWNAGLFFSCT